MPRTPFIRPRAKRGVAKNSPRRSVPILGLRLRGNGTGGAVAPGGLQGNSTQPHWKTSSFHELGRAQLSHQSLQWNFCVGLPGAYCRTVVLFLCHVAEDYQASQFGSPTYGVHESFGPCRLKTEPTAPLARYAGRRRVLFKRGRYVGREESCESPHRG